MPLREIKERLEFRFAQWWFRSVDSGGRRRLWQKLGKFIRNGVPILQALKDLHRRRMTMHGKSDPQCVALGQWIDGVKNGRSLAEVLRGWVGPVELMLISAGETSGNLEASLASATNVMEAGKQIRSAVWKGLTYPTILAAVALVVLYQFGFRVVPQFVKMVPAERLTGMASILIKMSTFAQNYLLWLCIALVIVIALFFFSLPRWDGRARVWLDRYAPYSIYRVLQGSTWLIGLSAMLEAGVRLEQALVQLSGLADAWLKNRIGAAIRGMRAGIGIGDALYKSGYEFPDREIIDDLAIYSSMSGFDEAIAILGKEWLTESVEQIRTKMSVVFVASFVLVASVVAISVSGLFAMELQMVAAMKAR